MQGVVTFPAKGIQCVFTENVGNFYSIAESDTNLDDVYKVLDRGYKK